MSQRMFGQIYDCSQPLDYKTTTTVATKTFVPWWKATKSFFVGYILILVRLCQTNYERGLRVSIHGWSLNINLF